MLELHAPTCTLCIVIATAIAISAPVRMSHDHIHLLRPVFQVINALLAGAVARSRLAKSEEAPQILVHITRADSAVRVSVCDCGQSLPNSLEAVQQAFTSSVFASQEEVECILSDNLICQTTGGQESIIRTYRVSLTCQPPTIIQTASLPKECEQPSSGTRVLFEVTSDWQDVYASAQALLEVNSMIAPPIQVELVAEAPAQQGDSSQQEAKTALEPLCQSIRYGLEVMPGWTEAERFVQGLLAWFRGYAGSETPDNIPGILQAELARLQQVRLVHNVLVPDKNLLVHDITVQISSGAAKLPVRPSGPSAWSARFAIVLGSAVSAGLFPLETDLPPTGSTSLYLFQDYALLQRPADSLLQAIASFGWADFNCHDVEIVPGAFQGSAKIIFSGESDPACLAMTAIVLHIYSPEQNTERGARSAFRLPVQNEAKLVKAALRDALHQVKEKLPGRLLSKLECRLKDCLLLLADSLAGLISESDNDALKEEICEAMVCNLEELEVALHQSFEGAICKAQAQVS